MSYLVVVSVAESDLSDRMITMRTWLDHQTCERDSFRYTPDAWRDGLFRVEFKFKHEAAAFAQAFRGRVVAPDRSDSCSTSDGSAQGNMTVIQVPLPSALSINALPPLRRAKAMTWLKPSPVPSPSDLVVKNGSNTRRRTSDGIPCP